MNIEWSKLFLHKTCKNENGSASQTTIAIYKTVGWICSGFHIVINSLIQRKQRRNLRISVQAYHDWIIPSVTGSSRGYIEILEESLSMQHCLCNIARDLCSKTIFSIFSGQCQKMSFSLPCFRPDIYATDQQEVILLIVRLRLHFI